jgi:DNA-binding MarR family transcriptional regulator
VDQSNPSFDLGMVLWQLGNRWRTDLARRLRPLGLTPTEYMVLQALITLSHDNEGASQQEVADWSFLDKMTVSHATRALDARSLISRDARFDGRSWNIILTTEGKALYKVAREVARRVHAKLVIDNHVVQRVREIHAVVARKNRHPQPRNRRKKGGGG